MIEASKFQYDSDQHYCPLCEEFVILREGQRSCKCTRVRKGKADHNIVFSWIPVSEIACDAKGCHHRDVGRDYCCDKGDIRCAFRNMSGMK